jgi:hypothetical protein
MNSAKRSPDPAELRPARRAWKLALPRALHRYRRTDPSQMPVAPHEGIPGSTRRRYYLTACHFVGADLVAVLYLLDEPTGYEVVVSRGGRVRESARVGFAEGNREDLQRALGVADRVIRQLTARTFSPKSRAAKAQKEADAWLRRRLEGLGK